MQDGLRHGLEHRGSGVHVRAHAGDGGVEGEGWGWRDGVLGHLYLSITTSAYYYRSFVLGKFQEDWSTFSY